jgi:hypothetical protein
VYTCEDEHAKPTHSHGNSLPLKAALAKAPLGLNGKEIAEGLGFTTPQERNRIKPLLADSKHFKRTGAGIGTKYFLK